MSQYDPFRHHRRSIRLKGYDYTTAGAYFVTIVTRHREHLFGEIVDGKMRLNELGQIVVACWRDLPNHYPHVYLDAFIIMPNHVHFVVVLMTVDVGAGLKPAPTTDDTNPVGVGAGSVGAGLRPAPTAGTPRHGLPEIVRALKSFSSRRINERRDTPGTAVWQRNYYERIIRNEREHNAIRQYIHNNPANWENDKENQ